MGFEIYLIPIIIALLISFAGISINQIKNKNITIVQPFKNQLSNDLYTLSFSKPFCWFIKTDATTKEVKEINQLIASAGNSHKMDYRVFTVIRTLYLMGGFMLIGMTMFGVDWIRNLISILFNIHMTIENVESEQTIQIIVVVLGFSLYMVPLYQLRYQAKKRNFAFIRDLPILQLFIVQMLKSNNPISQVLYLMSRIDTQYRDIFSISYRIYSRNPEEGLNYLRGSFQGTKFEETIGILQDYGEYSKTESINTLEHIGKDLEGHVKALTKNRAVSRLLASQGAIAIPFISVIVLAFVPIIIYGNSLMSQAQFSM